jgi:hypothetical protein
MNVKTKYIYFDKYPHMTILYIQWYPIGYTVWFPSSDPFCITSCILDVSRVGAGYTILSWRRIGLCGRAAISSPNGTVLS